MIFCVTYVNYLRYVKVEITSKSYTGEVGERVRRPRGDVEVVVSGGVDHVVGDGGQKQRPQSMMMWSAEELSTGAERVQLLHTSIFGATVLKPHLRQPSPDAVYRASA